MNRFSSISRHLICPQLRYPMEPIAGDQSPLQGSSVITPETNVELSDLVRQMNQVIRLLNDQKVRCHLPHSTHNIEHGNLHPSVWCLALGHRCNFRILLQCGSIATYPVDSIGRFILIYGALSSQGQGCESASLSARSS
jgi:hypothetical protein